MKKIFIFKISINDDYFDTSFHFDDLPSVKDIESALTNEKDLADDMWSDTYSDILESIDSADLESALNEFYAKPSLARLGGSFRSNREMAKYHWHVKRVKLISIERYGSVSETQRLRDDFIEKHREQELPGLRELQKFSEGLLKKLK